MVKNAKRIYAGAAIILVLTYFFPLWSINLNAPQYPEGIGLYIWINKITGKNPHDLKNINGLNHYIGMKEIHPQSIPELRIMPWIILFLIVSGLIGSIRFNRKFLYIWLALFMFISIIGIVDFYLWEYDYGHNLNPKAAIKIPGMSYQPPLIGSKQLLNMRTSSWPDLGGWTVLISIGLGVIAVITDRRGEKIKNSQKFRVPD